MSNVRYFLQSVILSVVLSAAILILISPAMGLTADNKEIPVEGIVADKNPDLSIAVINGEFYKKGAHYQDYEIVEIRNDRIIAKDKSGNLSEHRFKTTVTDHAAVAEKTAVSVTHTPSATNTEEAAPMTSIPSSPASWIDALQQFMQKQGWNIDIAGIFNYAHEVAIMADLRKLSSQANIALMDSDGETQTLNDMIKRGRVDPTYAGIKNGCRFRVDLDEHGVRVYADPDASGSTLRHFMVDSWGNLHAEKNKPATDKSPLVQTPSLPLPGFMSQKPAQPSVPQTDQAN